VARVDPIFKTYPTGEKPKWNIKPKHKIIRYGPVPPRHQWNIVGFLLILIGFLFQLGFYLN